MGATPAANVDPSKGMTLDQLVAAQKGAGATTASTPKPTDTATAPVTPPKEDLGQQTADEMQAGLNTIKDRATEGASKYAEGVQEGGVKGIFKSTGGLLESALGVPAGAIQTATAPITAVTKNILAKVAPDGLFSHFFDVTKPDGTVDTTVTDKVKQLIADHPSAGKTLSDLLTVGGVVLAGGDANIGDSLDSANKALTSAPKDVAQTVADAKAAITAPKAATTQATQTEMDAIGAKIAPKPTAAEAKIAQDEGRLVKGQQPTMFRSGTPDTVIPTKEEARAVGTIYREIPGASKMDEATLTNELNNTVSTKAQTLKPQMEATPIKPETVQKINDDWANIKAKQLSEADKTEEANVVKRQDAFQKNYLEKTKAENLNDLWETAKKYDASVPDKVKQASDLSDISLQNKKTEWLQNRSVLRSAITDSGSGLSEESSQAFADMHDMYNAKENLLSKAKIETKVAPSKIKQFSDSKTGKIVKNVVKASVGVAGLKEVIGH